MTKKTDNRRLVDVVRDVKIETADRDDVVVDMKEADVARIEILADRLKPTFEEVEDDAPFDFALSRGLQARLWIDAVAHIHMGKDRRSYRFVRDTRNGRTIIAEEHDVERMFEIVTRYIAERIIERERLIEGDYESLSDYFERKTEKEAPVEAAIENQAVEAPKIKKSWGWMWLILLAGIAVIATYLVFNQSGLQQLVDVFKTFTS